MNTKEIGPDDNYIFKSYDDDVDVQLFKHRGGGGS